MIFGLFWGVIQKLQLPVSVITSFNHQTGTTSPKQILYGGRRHNLIKAGYHHTFRQGRTLYHVFSMISEAMFFKLVLNTDNLIWTLEEVADGNAS